MAEYTEIATARDNATENLLRFAELAGISIGDAIDVVAQAVRQQAAVAEYREQKGETVDPDQPMWQGLATLHLPQDKYGYRVVSVSDSGRKVGLVRLATPAKPTTLSKGHGFPVIDHTFEADAPPDPDAKVEYAYRRKSGAYYLDDSRVTFDQARLYRDYSY